MVQKGVTDLPKATQRVKGKAEERTHWSSVGGQRCAPGITLSYQPTLSADSPPRRTASPKGLSDHRHSTSTHPFFLYNTRAKYWQPKSLVVPPGEHMILTPKDAVFLQYDFFLLLICLDSLLVCMDKKKGH